jgi:polysaccharide biosynthesis/export protein
LRQDAGAQVEITRRVVNGPIPLKTEHRDASGDFSSATVDLPTLVNGRDPSDNILISPNDVISVPRAEMVYVTGNVNKPGAFPLNEHNGITVLQAISLAEGLKPEASAKNAKVFRPKGDGAEKEEIPVNVSAIMNGKTVNGKSPDFTLQARDILFIPDSTSKKAGVRAAEAAVQAVTGMLIWGRL